MKLTLAFAAAALFVIPAFAQDAATLACAEYAAMDNAGKMALLAELESLNAEEAGGDEVSATQIAAELDANCTADPDMLIQDAWKKIKGM